MGILNRQELRLNRNETIFIEVYSTYPSSPENTKILICNSVDLSANGIQARIDEKLPIGAIYQLGVEIHATNERLHLVGEIKWLRDAEDGEGYAVGVAFFESDDTDIERWKTHIAQEIDNQE
jgi:hypothetical protein